MANTDNDICPAGIKLPERINRLKELAYNLWWSWNPEARNLFRNLDYPLWTASNHNPVRQLREISRETLESAVRDQAFLGSYDKVMSIFDDETASIGNLFSTGIDSLSGGVAFFSMEFAIHQSLPIYAGGLGVLAGDICKEASDLGLPLFAVGFMYPQGYFNQRISGDGWQEEIYRMVDFSAAPVVPCPETEERLPRIEIQLDGRKLLIKTWLVRIGKVKLYLLDTNLEENSPLDRLLTSRLYTADREQRLQQEIVLGIGGVRILQALGLKPSVWHGNEGHTSFMMLERLRQETEKGMPFSEGVKRVKACTIFTTHTPVPAGHDVFPSTMVGNHLRGCWQNSKADWQKFLELGRYPDASNAEFNMTVLGLRLSGVCNAVSEIHEKISRKMWQGVWPGTPAESVPIIRVTNGVHLPTWISPEMRELYVKYLGTKWLEQQDDRDLWKLIPLIPDEELWAVRQELKRILIRIMLERNRECSSMHKCGTDQILAMGSMFDADSLTLGFARRFVEYKRPTLILNNMELLQKLLTDKKRPVQLVFAGKSHPADFASKVLLNEIFTQTLDRKFEGRIAFIEDYDIHLAHHLAAGVDVWLNMPRRNEEACGTSGMKAALNGVLNFSVADGWWHEAFNGSNGWRIGEVNKPEDNSREDSMDVRSLYGTLQDKIIPLYYDRDRDGIPHGWIKVIKESVRSIVPQFCARKMMKEYSRLYFTLSREEAGIRQKP